MELLKAVITDKYNQKTTKTTKSVTATAKIYHS